MVFFFAGLALLAEPFLLLLLCKNIQIIYLLQIFVCWKELEITVEIDHFWLFWLFFDFFQLKRKSKILERNNLFSFSIDFESFQMKEKRNRKKMKKSQHDSFSSLKKKWFENLNENSVTGYFPWIIHKSSLLFFKCFSIRLKKMVVNLRIIEKNELILISISIILSLFEILLLDNIENS